MASVNDTVRDLIALYPCSYQNRIQALHQVLVVLGSGYDWKGGEAVSRFPEAESCLGLHERSRYSDEFVATLREIGIDVDEERVTGRCPQEELRTRADELAREAGPLGRDPYPPSYLTLLLTVPDDVKPDWAAAVAEMGSVVAPLWASDPDADSNGLLKDDQRAFIARHAN
ncbi:hypothetical protein ACIQVK_18820 [Streptomyces sp. NPDC090493]|uniref:hypothetical protein n=1 Tax=Streptomyces sp. NPDC090493 TaxID=3365964 RepID=UPI00382B61AD